MRKDIRKSIIGLIFCFTCITSLSCEKKPTYSNTSTNQVSYSLPEVVIIGCHLGDSIETVEEKLKEYNISSEKGDPQFENNILQFFDITCNSNKRQIPSDFKYGNLPVRVLRFRFFNNRLCQIEVFFKDEDLTKQEYEEVIGAFKKKYQFPGNNSSYYGPEEFRFRVMRNWSHNDDYRTEYNKYYTLCSKRSDGVYYFDDWNFGYWKQTPAHRIGIFDSKAGSEMIAFMKQQKAEGEKKKQAGLF